MSNSGSLGLSKKAKTTGLVLGLRESGSFLKNIKLLKGKSRKNSQDAGKNRNEACEMSGNHEINPPSNLGAECETQLLRVSSTEESSLSADDIFGERDCISPVVRNAPESQTGSPFQTTFGCDATRKPFLKLGQHNSLAATASSATLRKDDNGPLVRGKLTRHQQHGVKKDPVMSSQNSRGKLRRIHSMFASQKEVSQSYDDPEPRTLDPSEDNDSPRLPTFDSQLENSGISHYYDDKSDDHFPRIDVDTLVGIMDGRFNTHYDTVHIVDCRFEYEYQGGHIGQAININTRDALESHFFRDTNQIANHEQPPLMVFHCEFSSYRGPIMASHLRNCDRMLNHENYPKLHYPDILIVRGGYKSFFDRYSTRCYPRCYIGMDSLEHVALCESEMEKFRKDRKKIVTRANSTDSLSKVKSSSQPMLTRRNASTRLSCQSTISGLGGRTDHNFPSYYTTRSSLSFKHEAPPKLSFSNYCSSSESRSPSSVCSSNGSTGLLSLDELQDDAGSTDLDNISFEESGVHPQQQRADPAFPVTNAKRSLFGSILKEEEGEAASIHSPSLHYSRN
ncbi:LAFA_0C06920g1_1 [Lachancea sp. 'fantastica']|nr:LAFA_0C06920g1_1 [Lachancea sp. 'fantastica']